MQCYITHPLLLSTRTGGSLLWAWYPGDRDTALTLEWRVGKSLDPPPNDTLYYMYMHPVAITQVVEH